MTFCLHNKGTFDICMKKFVAKNIEKMAVMPTYTKSFYDLCILTSFTLLTIDERTLMPFFIFDRQHKWPVLLSLKYYTAFVSRIEMFPAN